MSAVNATPRSHRFKNLTGQRFGRLTVEGEAEPDKYKRARWSCLCDCGKRTTAHGSNLRRGHTTSCGCERRDTAAVNFTRHGHARKGNLSPTFRTWVDMVRRCRDENHKSYPDYGGRGVQLEGGAGAADPAVARPLPDDAGAARDGDVAVHPAFAVVGRPAVLDRLGDRRQQLRVRIPPPHHLGRVRFAHPVGDLHGLRLWGSQRRAGRPQQQPVGGDADAGLAVGAGEGQRDGLRFHSSIPET